MQTAAYSDLFDQLWYNITGKKDKKTKKRKGPRVRQTQANVILPERITLETVAAALYLTVSAFSNLLKERGIDWVHVLKPILLYYGSLANMQYFKEKCWEVDSRLLAEQMQMLGATKRLTPKMIQVLRKQIHLVDFHRPEQKLTNSTINMVAHCFRWARDCAVNGKIMPFALIDPDAKPMLVDTVSNRRVGLLAMATGASESALVAAFGWDTIRSKITPWLAQQWRLKHDPNLATIADRDRTIAKRDRTIKRLTTENKRFRGRK